MVSRGILRQNFTVKLNMEKLYEFIGKCIEQAADEYVSCDCDEWETDEDYIIFMGSYRTHYKSTYYHATLESPEENDMERIYLEYDVDLLSKLPPELAKMIEIKKIDESEDNVDYLEEDCYE